MGRIEISESYQTHPQSSRKQILPGLVISLICVVILLFFVNWQQFWQALQKANYTRVGLALGLTLLWLAVRSFFWRTLLQQKATLKSIFITVNEGYLLNNLLPFRLGEIGRAFLLNRKAGIPFFFVLSTIVLERAMDLILAVCLLLVTLPFVAGVEWAKQAALSAGGLVLLLFGLLFFFAKQRTFLIKSFDRAQTRFPWLVRFGGISLDSFINGLSILTDTQLFFQAIFWVILNWLVAIVQYHLFLSAFFPAAQWLWSAFTLGVIALGVAAPSSPSAVGVLELSAVTALSAFHLDPSISLAFAITVHLSQVVMTGVLGSYGLALDGVSLLSLYDQARALQHQKSRG